MTPSEVSACGTPLPIPPPQGGRGKNGEGRRPMTAVIAIDQGTTGSKAYRLETDGRFSSARRIRASPDLSPARLGRA